MKGFNYQLTEWCEIHEITFAIKQLREHGQKAVLGEDYVIRKMDGEYAVWTRGLATLDKNVIGGLRRNYESVGHFGQRTRDTYKNNIQSRTTN